MIVLKGQGGKSRRMLAFCTLGWGALASAFLMPLLWIRGVGSMFRAQDITTIAPPPAEKTQAAAPPAGGPQPTFCTLGWGALASAFLMPLLWIRGVGSMFR